MLNRNQSWMVLILVCVLAACCGCPNEKTSDKTDEGDVSKTKVVEPPVPTMPEVHMDEATEATCKVLAGDLMREAELPDLEGVVQHLPELCGHAKLTVLFFWNDGQADSLFVEDSLFRLDQDFVKPLAEKGVQVIGVNVGDSAEVVRQRLVKAEAVFPNLLDLDKKLFAEVATEKLPRVYLLDETGKILWFDTEFSDNSCKTLLVAIEAGLGEILER